MTAKSSAASLRTLTIKRTPKGICLFMSIFHFSSFIWDLMQYLISKAEEEIMPTAVCGGRNYHSSDIKLCELFALCNLARCLSFNV